MTKLMSRSGTCDAPGCEADILARRLCNRHYIQTRKRGFTVTEAVSEAEFIWARIERQHSGCWNWTGPLTHKGYGSYRRRGPNGEENHLHAHRVVYELLVEPIAPGLEIDHLCVNRRCVNPAHLEPVTHTENIRRGFARRKVDR